MKGKLVVLFGMLLSCFVNGIGQNPYGQYFSQSTGLPSNVIYSMLEDKNGFIWFTSDEGLCRYDGSDFKLYRSNEQRNFAGSSIMQDAQNRIWHLDFDGNAFYQEGESLVRLNQNTKASFYALKATQRHIFIQEQHALVAVDSKTLKPIKRFQTKQFINAAAVINKDYYFIDDKTLYCIGSDLKLRKNAELPINNEFPLLFSLDDRLLLVKKNSVQNGIWEIKNGTCEKVYALGKEVVVQHAKAIKGKVYLLTSSGFQKINPNTWAEGEWYFRGKNISDILIDYKHNVWVSSNLEGLGLYPNIKILHYSFPDFNPLRVRSYADRLLISSTDEKVSWFSPTTGKFEVFSEGKSFALPYYLYIDTLHNELVRVQSDGYSYFSNLLNKTLFQKSVLAIKHISPLDYKYNVFVASGMSGLYCHKKDLNRPSSFDKYLKLNQPRVEGEYYFYTLPIEGRGKFTCVDKKSNKVFFITNLGTYVWKNGKTTELILPKNNGVLTALVNWNNKLIGLTIDGQIIDLKTQKAEQAFKNIKNIKQIRTQEGFLFVRSPDLLCVFEISSSGKAVLKGSLDLHRVESLDFCLLKNTVWVMTSNGFISWILNQKRKTHTDGRFIITSIFSKDKKLDFLEKAELRYDQNNLKINFAIPDYGNVTISNVQYKLNSQPWTSIARSDRAITFPALATGNYVLQIRYQLHDKWKLAAKYNFSIVPPIWGRTWFYILCFFAIMIVFYFYTRYKVNQTKAKNKLKNKMIVLENSLNKSLLASIKSQMNPHFIFNALNTIQAYIYTNDKENATGYLSKFSKLTRSILEMSEKETVSLEKEIEALKLYLDLEKMRFQNEFTYRFESNNLDVQQIKIPSMLLQPYVENAIKHGLLHSEGSKHLEIITETDKEYLIVKIDDNGIGRKRSEELRKSRNKYHVGFSTKANELRMNLLNANQEVTVEYIDKEGALGEPLGTTVILKIAFKK
jgi:hypothetical protein